MSLKRFTTHATSLLLAILVAVLIITSAIPVRASVTDFNGPSLPADWFATAWFSGGAATSTNGTLAVDGALTGTVALYGPGLSLEFVATFTGAPWQHIGFGLDYNAAPGSSSAPSEGRASSTLGPTLKPGKSLIRLFQAPGLAPRIGIALTGSPPRWSSRLIGP